MATVSQTYGLAAYALSDRTLYPPERHLDARLFSNWKITTELKSPIQVGGFRSATCGIYFEVTLHAERCLEIGIWPLTYRKLTVQGESGLVSLSYSERFDSGRALPRELGDSSQTTTAISGCDLYTRTMDGDYSTSRLIKKGAEKSFALKRQRTF